MEGNRSRPAVPKPRRKFKRLLKKLPSTRNECGTRDPEDKRPVIIMAQNEGRLGRITDIRSCWAPKGISPKIPQQVVRTFVYVYAADVWLWK